MLRQVWLKPRVNHIGDGIINFIDVGSVGGLPETWSNNISKIKFLLNFEPSDEIKKGHNYVTYNTALWERNETRIFYVYKGLDGTGSSLFKQNYTFVKKHWAELKDRGPKKLSSTWHERSKLKEKTQLECRSLDSVLDESFKGTHFHFIKIDAQGAESSILKGANKFLSTSCVGLQLELFVIPLYVGAPLMDEVVDYLLGFDFKLVKKFQAHGSFDSQHECVFLHKSRSPEIVDILKSIYQIT